MDADAREHRVARLPYSMIQRTQGFYDVTITRRSSTIKCRGFLRIRGHGAPLAAYLTPSTGPIYRGTQPAIGTHPYPDPPYRCLPINFTHDSEDGVILVQVRGRQFAHSAAVLEVEPHSVIFLWAAAISMRASGSWPLKLVRPSVSYLQRTTRKITGSITCRVLSEHSQRCFKCVAKRLEIGCICAEDAAKGTCCMIRSVS